MVLKISWVKSSNDNKSFKLFKNLGMDVFDVENLDNTDMKLKELVDADYNTIIISNELAGFSEDIIKKYSRSEGVSIIITPGRGE
jgi:vacuolar-type H+-ATPase subunit F/Vma7